MSYTIRVIGEARPERKLQRFPKTRSGRVIVGKRTDEPTRAEWKTWVRLEALRVCTEPIDGPLYVDIIVCKPRPQSYPKRPTKSFPWPWHWTKKPDTNNLAKPIEDALNGIAWHDDAQIVDSAVHKRFGPRHEAIITVTEQSELGWRVPKQVQETWEMLFDSRLVHETERVTR